MLRSETPFIGSSLVKNDVMQEQSAAVMDQMSSCGSRSFTGLRRRTPTIFRPPSLVKMTLPPRGGAILKTGATITVNPTAAGRRRRTAILAGTRTSIPGASSSPTTLISKIISWLGKGWSRLGVPLGPRPWLLCSLVVLLLSLLFRLAQETRFWKRSLFDKALVAFLLFLIFHQGKMTVSSIANMIIFANLALLRVTPEEKTHP